MKDLVILLKIMWREIFTLKEYTARVNEPTMEMGLEEQALAFKKGSDFAGPLASPQLLAAYFISRAIRDANVVLDLGCGTGHVLTKVAYINPDKQFVALDLSPAMLEKAKDLAASLNLTNVEFYLGDMTDLKFFADKNIDAIVSTLALHHLRSVEDLTKTFTEAKKILKGSGALTFFDIGRFKFIESIYNTIEFHKGDYPEVLKEDTLNSYLAAFNLLEFKAALEKSGLDLLVDLKATLFIPNFIKMNTPLKSLGREQRERIEILLNQLSAQNKQLYKILRLYFLS
jgi:ubiquinone/menaquinone biosynthesis C-methylase UbiE